MHDGVIQLLLNYLDDPHAPSAVLSVMANRSDPKFIRLFLRKIGWEPLSIVSQNLKRLTNIAWMRYCEKVVDQLEDTAQHSLVQLVITSGIPRTRAFSVLEYILLHGKPGGRREAARALATFNGAEANDLALQALSDPDPQVQANILQQLRRRNIPNLLPRLVKMLDSPHLEVRQAVRNSLGEFTFIRYISTFDMLDEESRKSTGILVKKVDLQTIPLLREELQSTVRARKMRGFQIVHIMHVADRVEDILIEMLQSDDRVIRSEAADLLTDCNTQTAKNALSEAYANNLISSHETTVK